ncbi:hypothetical protein HanPSC8_Chr12g0504411 [Helianthus annuus]|nr:hypothetical protein HanPSC8_Chr12g0504411 [Helianthus annuus]
MLLMMQCQFSIGVVGYGSKFSGLLVVSRMFCCCHGLFCLYKLILATCY